MSNRKKDEQTFRDVRNCFEDNNVQISSNLKSNCNHMYLHRVAAAEDKFNNIWVFGILTYHDKTYYTLENGNFNPNGKRQGNYIIKKGEYPVESYIWYKQIEGTDIKVKRFVPWIKDVEDREGILGHDGTWPWNSKGCVLFLFQKGEAKEIYLKLNEHGGRATIRVTNSDQVDEVLEAELDAHSHDLVAQGESEGLDIVCGSWEEDIFDETPLAYDSDITSNIILYPESLNPYAILCIDNLDTTSEHNTNESDDKTDVVEVVPIPDDNSLQMSTNTSSFTLSEVSTTADFDEDSNKATQQNKTNIADELNVGVFVDQAQDDNSSNTADNPLHTTPTIISDKVCAGDATKTETKAKNKTKTKKKTKKDKETSTDINYDKSLYVGSTNYQPRNIIKKWWALEQFFLKHDVEKHVVTKVNLSLYINPSNSSSDSSAPTCPTESKASGKPSSVPSPSTQGSKEVTDSYLSNIEDYDNNKVGRQVQKQNGIAPITVGLYDEAPCNKENKYSYNPDESKNSKDDDNSPSTSSEPSVTSTSNQGAMVEDIVSDHVIIEPSPSVCEDKTTENQDKQHDMDKSNSLIKSLTVIDTPDNNKPDVVTPNVYKITSIDFKDDIQRKSDADQVSNINASTPLSNSTAQAYSNDNNVINNDKCYLKNESNPVWGDSQTDDVEVDQSSDINRLYKQNDDMLNVNKEPTPARGDEKVDDVGVDSNIDKNSLQNPCDSPISSVEVEKYESDKSNQVYDKNKDDKVGVDQNSDIGHSNIENDSKASPCPTEDDTTNYDRLDPYNMKPEAETEDVKAHNKILVIEA
ncbi:hypothetical protein AGMMS49531_03510 [Endomicrobiia bacterium]|nr:hypothetical protein AGMMS49531_03510 [Endomicrobiia bacterium]